MDEIMNLYKKQQDMKKQAHDRVEYFVSTFFTTDEIVQSVIDDIKKSNYDQELFDFYQDELFSYVAENIKYIGTSKYKRYLDMVLANSTWMYVLMNPEDIKLYVEYQMVNKKYNIHKTEV